MNKVVYIIVFCVIYGCGLETQIDDAAQKCEDQMAAILENIEDTCLTKEEILELIRANNKYLHRYPSSDITEKEPKNE